MQVLCDQYLHVCLPMLCCTLLSPCRMKHVFIEPSPEVPFSTKHLVPGHLRLAATGFFFTYIITVYFSTARELFNRIVSLLQFLMHFCAVLGNITQGVAHPRSFTQLRFYCAQQNKGIWSASWVICIISGDDARTLLPTKFNDT